MKLLKIPAQVFLSDIKMQKAVSIPVPDIGDVGKTISPKM
jgi:hypothetical protein